MFFAYEASCLGFYGVFPGRGRLEALDQFIAGGKPEACGYFIGIHAAVDGVERELAPRQGFEDASAIAIDEHVLRHAHIRHVLGLILAKPAAIADPFQGAIGALAVDAFLDLLTRARPLFLEPLLPF